ncbi:hypothetical protein FDP41_000113 [Naegleria fowleri]|uniref:Uncharacterized protein n=1 Tax=Naegleria fowleri TaxID=5763 RepID=A0A6A5CEQ9_NAEFO|nr:uncharacterized protein FDP41_000113 [Naegleria fowleri]KAF0985074.1 hypothetical protein FDP41_000113 [Naegleria fowleri]
MSEDTIRFVDETKQTQDTYSYLKPIGIRKLRKQINTKEFKKNYFVIDTRKDEPMVVHYDSAQGIAPPPPVGQQASSSSMSSMMVLSSSSSSSSNNLNSSSIPTPNSGSGSGSIISPLKTSTKTPTFEFQSMCLNGGGVGGGGNTSLPSFHFNTASPSQQHADLSMGYFGMNSSTMDPIMTTHTPASTPTNGHPFQFMQAPFLPQQPLSHPSSINHVSSSSMKRKHAFSSSSSSSSSTYVNSRRTLSMPDCLVNFSPNETAMNLSEYEIQSSLNQQQQQQQQLQANKKCKLGNEISPTHHHILNGEQQIMFSNQAWTDGNMVHLNQQPQPISTSQQPYFDFSNPQQHQDCLFEFGDNNELNSSYPQNSMTKHISLNHYPQLHQTQIQLLETLQMILNQNHPQQLDDDEIGAVIPQSNASPNTTLNEQENSQLHHNQNAPMMVTMDQQQSYVVTEENNQQPPEYQYHQQLWNDIDENGIFSPVDQTEFLLQDLSGDTTNHNNLNNSSSDSIVENSSPQPSNE